jgi:hypothetical protein
MSTPREPMQVTSTGLSSRRRSSAPSFTELVDEYSRLNRMVMDSVNQMVVDALDPRTTRRAAPRSRLDREECCGDPCDYDPCHCRCCIVDADLAIYARIGELRVAPIRIENLRRREREITLDLSGWTTSGGKNSPIKAVLRPGTQFTLGPCSEAEVLLEVDTRPAAVESSAADIPRLPDVDDCQVLYADLRVEGCSIRPIRIALVLLPRDCDPYVIECGCACC